MFQLIVNQPDQYDESLSVFTVEKFFQFQLWSSLWCGFVVSEKKIIKN